MRFRVATYNIRKAVGRDLRRRPDRVLAVLEEIGADIVALQEADRRFGTRLSALPPQALAEAGWRAAPVAPHPGGIGWLGNAILLAPSVGLRSARRLLLPAWEPRGAALAEVTVAGRSVSVIGAHLGLAPWPRRLQVARLMRVASRLPGPALLMGDMNDPGGRGGALGLLSDGWSLAPPCASFPASWPLVAFDRIAVFGGLAPIGAAAHATPLARRASDHLPVVADVAPGPAP